MDNCRMKKEVYIEHSTRLQLALLGTGFVFVFTLLTNLLLDVAILEGDRAVVIFSFLVLFGWPFAIFLGVPTAFFLSRSLFRNRSFDALHITSVSVLTSFIIATILKFPDFIAGDVHKSDTTHLAEAVLIGGILAGPFTWWVLPKKSVGS